MGDFAFEGGGDNPQEVIEVPGGKKAKADSDFDRRRERMAVSENGEKRIFIEWCKTKDPVEKQVLKLVIDKMCSEASQWTPEMAQQLEASLTSSGDEIRRAMAGRLDAGGRVAMLVRDYSVVGEANPKGTVIRHGGEEINCEDIVDFGNNLTERFIQGLPDESAKHVRSLASVGDLTQNDKDRITRTRGAEVKR